MKRPLRTKTARVLPVVLGAALLLAGCAPAPDLGRATAVSLQDGVLAVTTASASGDYQAASDALRTTIEQLEKASADGTVSPEKYRQIRAALAQVETDLQNAITAAELQRMKDEVAKQQADAQAALDKAAEDQAALDQATRDQAAEEQAAADQTDGGDLAPAPDTEPGNGGKDDKGKGNDGKGNGKNK